MNGIDALKAKFADVELKANARTMEEVVAYIEENWGAFRVKITEGCLRICKNDGKGCNRFSG